MREIALEGLVELKALGEEELEDLRELARVADYAEEVLQGQIEEGNRVVKQEETDEEEPGVCGLSLLDALELRSRYHRKEAEKKRRKLKEEEEREGLRLREKMEKIRKENEAKMREKHCMSLEERKKMEEEEQVRFTRERGRECMSNG